MAGRWRNTFATPSLQFTVLKPFEVTKTSNSFDVKVKTTGGGITGQAGAIRLAISRALLLMTPRCVRY